MTRHTSRANSVTERGGAAQTIPFSKNWLFGGQAVEGSSQPDFDDSDFGSLLEILRRTPEEFTVFVGPDALLVPGLAMGADGGMNGLSNVAPTELCKMYNTALNGDYEAALTQQAAYVQPLYGWSELFTGFSPLVPV